MTDPSYPPEAILPEHKGTFTRGDLMAGVHSALIESYQAQQVKALVVTRWPNGRLLVQTESTLPMKDEFNYHEEDYLVGLTSPDGSQMTIHPAWAQWLEGASETLPTEPDFTVGAGRTAMVVRSHAGPA